MFRSELALLLLAACSDLPEIDAPDAAASTLTFEVRESALCGLHLAVGGSATLAHGRFTRNPIAVCADLPIELLAPLTDVELIDNGTNLSSQTLPVPDPTR